MVKIISKCLLISLALMLSLSACTAYVTPGPNNPPHRHYYNGHGYWVNGHYDRMGYWHPGHYAN